MNSDLELLVKYDMYEKGFDPDNIEDVNIYWEERLNDTCGNLH